MSCFSIMKTNGITFLKKKRIQNIQNNLQKVWGRNQQSIK